MSTTTGGYYFAPPSKWPVVGSTAHFFFASGLVLWMNQIQPWGNISLVIGLGILFYMLFGWFGNVIHESEAGMYLRATSYPRTSRTKLGSNQALDNLSVPYPSIS